MITAWPTLLALLAQADMGPLSPGGLEGRPATADASALQARVDAAAPGDVLLVETGRYDGDLLIDKPLALVGRGRPLLRGSGRGSVVRVRAANVRIEGLDIDGQGGGDLGRDTSGIHVAAPGVRIVDCRVHGSLFGIYLREAPGAVVQGSQVVGIPERPPGEKGSGIHVWNTDGFELEANVVHDTRDGMYIQSSPHGVVRGNVVADLRYGLHYMYSDDNLFEDNTFENTAAGTVLMYSRRIVFRRNRVIHNRGYASVGLLFKACDDTLAEDNLIADNARGIFLEGSNNNLFRRNVIAESDVGIVLYDSCSGVRFEGNSFVANLTPLDLVGRRTDTVFLGNYWSDNNEPDFDGDGRSDRPYTLSSLFDHMRGNLSAADLLTQSVAALAVAAAERAFPVLEPVRAADPAALVRPPSTADLPARREPDAGPPLLGWLVSIASVLLGLGIILGGRRAARARGAAA